MSIHIYLNDETTPLAIITPVVPLSADFCASFVWQMITASTPPARILKDPFQLKHRAVDETHHQVQVLDKWDKTKGTFNFKVVTA